MKKQIFLPSLAAMLFAISCSNPEPAKQESSEPAVAAKPAAVEIMDSALIGPANAAMDAFAKGNINDYVADMDDNVRYVWSGGDSAIGKKAVTDYYTGRWKVIDSIAFSNRIFLPVKVNESASGNPQKGKWLLTWYQVNVKYKNGKKLQFWVHNTAHYNDAGKIDFTAQYIDRAPIMAASK